MEKPLKERRHLLESELVEVGSEIRDQKFITKKVFLSSNVFKVTFEVGNSVKLSDLTRVSKKSELAAQIKSVLSQVPEFPCGFVMLTKVYFRKQVQYLLL